ncbi:MAG TPA: hypothetical protein VK453_05255 [Micromonosporaceae bacterium]|nr:hypothetical protein [Micromonosporaceae bacterium]
MRTPVIGPALDAQRPALVHRLLDAPVPVARAGAAVALLLLAPAACFLLAVHAWLIGPFLVVLIGGGAWFAGYLGRVTGRWTAPFVVWLPAVATAMIMPIRTGMFGEAEDPTAGTLLWALVLGATLLVASRLAGRVALAVGAVGGLAACWLALTLVVWRAGWRDPLDPSGALDGARAVLWYPASVFWQLDILGSAEASWNLVDYIEQYPGALTLTAAYAVGYVLGAAVARLDAADEALPDHQQ